MWGCFLTGVSEHKINICPNYQCMMRSICCSMAVFHHMLKAQKWSFLRCNPLHALDDKWQPRSHPQHTNSSHMYDCVTVHRLSWNIAGIMHRGATILSNYGGGGVGGVGGGLCIKVIPDTICIKVQFETIRIWCNPVSKSNQIHYAYK